jgi:hypothetical protein
LGRAEEREDSMALFGSKFSNDEKREYCEMRMRESKKRKKLVEELVERGIPIVNTSKVIHLLEEAGGWGNKEGNIGWRWWDELLSLWEHNLHYMKKKG